MSYPFDLERALKGEAVVTRDGREIRHIGRRHSVLGFDVLGIIEGEREQDGWTIQGRYFKNAITRHDLFMLNPSTDVDNS